MFVGFDPLVVDLVHSLECVWVKNICSCGCCCFSDSAESEGCVMGVGGVDAEGWALGVQEARWWCL